MPKQPFYMTGNVGGKGFSVHAEGERVILTRAGEERQEVALSRPAEVAAPDPEALVAVLPAAVCPQGIVTTADGEEEDEELPPGVSALDRLAPPVAEGGEA